MARTNGPLFSFDASGTVGKTITFSRWKGRPYVRQRVIPANPKSPLQVSVRAMMKFLSQQWAGLTSPNQATWETLASQSTISPFNAFTKENLRRFGNFESPSKEYPAAESATPATLGATTPTGGVRQVSLVGAAGTLAGGWGILLHRSLTTGFTPGRDTVVAVVPFIAAAAWSYVDTPLLPATYFYRAQTFTTDGILSVAQAQVSATVT